MRPAWYLYLGEAYRSCNEISPRKERVCHARIGLNPSEHLRINPTCVITTDPLSEEESTAFTEAARPEEGERRIILRTLLRIGAHDSELINFRVEDVSLAEGHLPFEIRSAVSVSRCPWSTASLRSFRITSGHEILDSFSRRWEGTDATTTEWHGSYARRPKKLVLREVRRGRDPSHGDASAC